MTHEEFHTVVAPTAITDVSCVGTESKLTECFYRTSTACSQLNDAGVVCQGEEKNHNFNLYPHLSSWTSFYLALDFCNIYI